MLGDLSCLTLSDENVYEESWSMVLDSLNESVLEGLPPFGSVVFNFLAWLYDDVVIIYIL